MVWFVLAGLTAFAVLAAIWPLLRSTSGRSDDTPASSEAAFYRAQLDEIRRDVERGQLPQSEAEGARAEAARRLIAAGAQDSGPSAAPRGRNRLAAAALIIIGLPAVAFPLYALLGEPQMRDEPLATREPAIHAASDLNAAVAGVEKHLIAEPDDGKGWAVLAPVYMRLERYEDAAHAYSEALRLLGEDPARRAAYGEALVAGAGGVVTDRAREAFGKALANDPAQPQARFYLALAAEQDGKTADAIRAYEAIAADAPPNAPWLVAVNTRLAKLKGEPAPTTGQPSMAGTSAPDAPALGSPQQQAMIEGMVSRLADRLATKGGSVDEWARLVRAYTVLHQDDKAKAALARARTALAPDANAVASLDALAHDLGLSNGSLAKLNGDAQPSSGQPAAAEPPAFASPEEKAMIESMVSRLADRLATKGGSVDEWARLIRAYTVLHQDEKAKAALGEARKALAPDADAVASLDALAHDLGLGDAN